MQSLCHLSRRWHQQFCRSLSFAKHQHCLAPWQAVRNYRQRSFRAPSASKPSLRKQPLAKPTVDTGDLVVREYEQNELDPTDRRPLDRQNDPLIREENAIKAEIQKLEKELEVMRRGPFARGGAFMQSIPKDERESLLQELEAQGFGDNTLDDLVADEDLEIDAEEDDERSIRPVTPEVTLRVPFKHKVYVKQFNTALKELNEDPGELKCHLNVWKWYLRCQQKVDNFSHFVSDDVWDLLWNSQIKTYPLTRHIVVLARDMIAAGNGLSTAQLLDYIDALDKTGETSTALSDWETEMNRVGFIKDTKLAARFWGTGVRLYATLGRPLKAEEIALTALDADDIDLRVFVPVIEAWAKSQKPDASTKIWSCYIRMKNRLAQAASAHGDEPVANGMSQIDTLGQISSVLLNNGYQDLALAVFQDMLAAHDQKGRGPVQTGSELLQKDKSKDDESMMIAGFNTLGVAAPMAFPGRFRNKFFFGAWIKWLIGDGKVDDAALVVELMQELEVKPDARHLNGIVGAWLRDSSTRSRAKAEQMAWAMIHARIEQVCPSQPVSEGIQNVELHPYADKQRLPPFLQKTIPAATVETFSLLLQMYGLRGDVAKATELTDIMEGLARLKPNSFILNQWLHMSLRANDLGSMWQRYVATKDEITPDLETFAVLWSGMQRNLDRSRQVRSQEYPDPRKLFLEMKQWLDKSTVSRAQSAKADFSSELYEQIVRCFCLNSDLLGTFMALKVLNDNFNALPSANVPRMVLMQVARMLPAPSGQTSKPRRPALLRRDIAYRSSLSMLANVMQNMSDHQATAAIDNGATVADVEDSDSQVSQALRLRTIQVFICMISERMQKGGGTVLNGLVQAGDSMGVELIPEVARTFIEEAGEFSKHNAGIA